MRRTIQNLLDMDAGKPLTADKLLSQPESEIHLLRRKLKEEQLRFKKGDVNCISIACDLCHQPVVISGTQKQEYFFKHGYESGSCPIKTTDKYTHEEINRMKYNGAKESRRHLDLKSAIVSALQSKNSSCNNVQSEKRINSKGLSKEWRKPDVKAICGDKHLVFEIQLSTTFLDVIVERESFYQSEQVFMLWVFDKFTEGGARFTEKDIYYANNRNAYVITDETRKRSKDLGELVLDCHYQEPFISDNKVINRWIIAEVVLSDLIFDTTTYRAYYFDYDSAEKKLYENIGTQSLASEFAGYWERRQLLSGLELYEEDKKHFAQLKSEGLIPDSYLDASSFPEKVKHILDALYCLKKGRMFAYRYGNWIQLANQVLEYHQQFAGIFIRALKQYELMDEIIDSDKKNSFQNKRKRIVNGIKVKDSKYEQNLEFRPLFKVLFPELMQEME